MTTKRIEDMDKWLILKQAIIENGYILFQTQYSSDQPEGYCARFMKDSKRVEVVTHNEDIERDIQSSNM